MTLFSASLDVKPPAMELSNALTRYQRGEARNVVFRDLIQTSLRQFTGDGPTVLDIGCGHGFDGDAELQRSIGATAGYFIGVEPDRDILPPACFTEVHQCLFEEASLEPESVHVAYAAFVLEHVEQPGRFWQKLYRCMAPGGVFWGFTVDSRHLFSLASQLAGKLKLKDTYLDWLRGRRGVDRYENYKTFYRANSPAQIRRHTQSFSSMNYQSFHRVGQLDYYFPRLLWPPLHWTEQVSMSLRFPGSILVVRIQK